MQTAEQVRTVRFSLFEAEVARLREFTGRLEKNIHEAVTLFIEDQRQARPINTTSNLYSHGNLQSFYIKLPASLAQQLNVWAQRPEEAVSWYPSEFQAVNSG